MFIFALFLSYAAFYFVEIKKLQKHICLKDSVVILQQVCVGLMQVNMLAG